jgi:hypothetical protein
VLDWIEHSSPVVGIATILEFLWELSLGIYSASPAKPR